ncbi:hypothetical protein JCM11491_006554 [Sporobolomyces phaffii]
MAPASNTSTPGHPRLAQLAHSTTSDSLSSLQNSPSSARSTRNLGAIGGRSGPGYSPYARRVSRAVAAREEEEEVEDDATIRGDESERGDSPVQQRNGLFGRVKSLPGKALGWLTRSSSSKTLSTSSSLADVRAAVEEEQAKEQGDGMQRSKTAYNLAGPTRAGGGETPSALPSRLRRQPLQKDSLPSSSSMSALSSVASPFAPSGLRSSHSTLNLASTAANGNTVTSFLTASNLSRHSRAVSPALSSASYAHSRRSPSPMRNGLAGSMSTFNLAQPRSPASAFGVADTTLGNAALSHGSNPFGLTSRSPFAAGRPGSQRAVSVAGSVRSTSTRPEGHALFPYTSTIPRGASPSIAASQSMREGLSSLASVASPQPNSAPSTAQKRPYARVGSPLNPRSPVPPADGEDSQTNGFERARKKQMVWDPSRGLISRERLEAEKERDAPPLPKNEAERILEVLEGMGRTPLGEAKRGAVRPKKISVPAPVSPGLGSGARIARSSNGPSTAPYSARTNPMASNAASSGKGLQSVLRAREERRRALVEQEREERARERREKEERERRREERRRELERLEREADEEDELESVMSQDYDDEEERPKRRTRSSTAASKSKSKNLEPPTPRRSTRASSRTAKSPSPAPTPKKKAKSKRAQEEAEEKGDDAEMEPPSTRRKRSMSKSPAPPSEGTERVQSQSPPPPPKIVFPPPPVGASSSSNPSQRSSLRPGKSHSSRQHVASSKVFSAREEDLPPINDDALSKIQMPAMKFPAGFSFGGSAPLAAKKTDDEPKSSLAIGGEKKDEGSNLLGRLSAPPASTAPADKPTFSFTPSAPSTSASTIPPIPAISFGTAASTAKPAAPLFKPSEPATDLFAPKPSSTGFSFATPSTATPVPKPTVPAPAAEGDKPNFFASIVNEKKDEAPKIAPLPSFSFGASTSTPVVKPTEVVTPESEKEKKDAAPPTANPFAAFGKPVSEIIKESQEGKKDEEDKPAEAAEAPKPAFSFGASIKPAEVRLPIPSASCFPLIDRDLLTQTAPAATSAGSAFSFKPAPATSTPAATSPFSFGASKPADAAKKPEVAAPAPAFSFGSNSTAATTSTPKATFTFGTTPATPTAEEKESTPASSAPASPFGALAPPAPASVAGTDDADGDSGMEDEAEPSTSSAAKPAAPAPFTFGAAAPPPPASTSGGLFGTSSTSTQPSSTGFSFGSTDKKETPSLFGAPGASSSSASLFGGASAAPKPFTFGSPSPSPAPSSPAVASASTPFSFGQPAAAAPASTFTFGSTPAANPSPFGAPAQPASPAPASTGFSFGASSSNPPASPAAPFAFGSSATAPSSSIMGQTLSAPGANGSASPFGAPAASGGGFSFGSSASQPVSPSASTSTPSFSFGASAAPASGSTFSFGAPASGQAPAAASPFGAPSPAASGGGFSFGAPSGSGATTPTGGGLFNLGSGGEDAAAKSGRPIRPLRRRK